MSLPISLKLRRKKMRTRRPLFDATRSWSVRVSIVAPALRSNSDISLGKRIGRETSRLRPGYRPQLYVRLEFAA